MYHVLQLSVFFGFEFLHLHSKVAATSEGSMPRFCHPVSASDGPWICTSMDHEFAPPFLLFTSFPHCSLKSCMPLAPQLSPRMLSAPLQMLLWQFSAPELLLGFLSTVKIRFFSTPRMDTQSCCANCCGKSCRKRPGKACRFGVRPPEHGQMSWGQLDEAMQHVLLPIVFQQICFELNHCR